MLAQMPRQILQPFTQFPIFPHAVMVQIEACLLKMIFKSIRRPAPLSAIHLRGKTIECFLVESSTLPTSLPPNGRDT